MAITKADLAETLFTVGLFQKGGLSQQQALRMVTSWPAELLGVSQRVGSLAVGKDADFVALSSEPFGPRSHIRATYIGGQRHFRVTEQQPGDRVIGRARSEPLVSFAIHFRD